ncbi:MAG TPA: hypothetical protein VL547_18225 [Dinghuibacter sp.]|jgi:hypothetical protein|uniref:type IX secretion system anionic LPS delivery protein PorZ n=1 Tax=Dinghuibacter sp. TaxID=2024697 RepID=UPI002CAB0ED9|nr:hypothetical protein [Dinghuibacter sp.]HTJ13983.1 hypothetical protein [Dinghuibacter sp.]
MRLAIFWLWMVLPGCVCAQLQPIGAWRSHLSYHHAQGIGGAAGDIWVATPQSVFNVSGPDNVITRYSTINGLHSIGVNALAAAQGVVVIGYANSDVDLVEGSSITEVPDLEIAQVTGDKTIHDVHIEGGSAYLSTGLGIVVVGISAAAVEDTYVIGPGGVQTPVYAVASDSQYWYAATATGLRKAPKAAANLADFSNWQVSTGDAGMDILPCQDVIGDGQTIYVLRNDSVYAYTGGVWRPWYAAGWTIRAIQTGGDSLIISEQDPGGTTGRITWLGTAGAVARTLEGASLADPRGVLVDDAVTWIADAQRGLLLWNGATLEALVPNSPDGPLDGQMQAVGGDLWIAGGGDTTGFYHFDGSQWTAFNSLTQPAMAGTHDVGAIAVRGDTVYAGATQGGLFRLTGGLAAGAGSGSITGLAYDSSRRLWMINSGAQRPLEAMTPDGSVTSYGPPFLIPGNQLGAPVSDAYGYIWAAGPSGYGALCFNPATQQWKSYLPGAGQGNLPDPTVNCIIMDRQGLVWMGTNNGIGVVECGASIFSGGCDVTWPVVQQDAFAGYLFQGQSVRCMAVDGADRKWVGTTAGAWLISEDGTQVITTFNTANSPLFNDTINAIGIDGKTGEVFFSTPAGMCSFRGDATQAGQSGGLLVFPNPVPPGYSGTIAVRGVPEGAVVKITELGGRLVYQTVALGGQAVWNGNDYSGRRVATGVYLVLVAGPQNQEHLAAKIVFIH